jgi:hypothetical protein
MVSQGIKMVVVREREVVGSLLWSSNEQVPSAVWKPNPIRNLNAYLIMMSFSLRRYSRGQAKHANKNGNSVMRSKATGKRADILREASGQVSHKFDKSHELPLSRKYP